MKYTLMASVAMVATLVMFTSLQAQDREDRSVRVCNHASSRIVNIFATNKDDPFYGRDLLVGNIPSGTCRTVDPGYSQGYCILDWKAVAANGQFAAKRFNTCELPEWHIYN